MKTHFNYRLRLALVLSLIIVLESKIQIHADAPVSSREELISELTEKTSRVDNLIADVEALKLSTREEIEQSKERSTVSPFMFQARLTLESGVPISTTSQANKSTIYLTPYKGNRIALYNTTSSIWEFVTLTSEVSLALSGLTANTNYDVFVYNNAGTVTIDTFTAWASNTARATALTTQNGVLVKSGTLSRRYVGTFRATAATQTQDTYTQRFLYNYYHREPRPLKVVEGTASWVNNNSTIHQTNGAAANVLEYVIGYEEEPIFTNTLLVFLGDATNRNGMLTCVGIDATTSCIADSLRGGNTRSVLYQPLWSESNHHHGIGYHALEWNEAQRNGTNATMYGDDAGDGRVQSGFVAAIWG